MSPIFIQYNFSKEDYTAFYNYSMWANGSRKKNRVNDIIKTVANIILFSIIFYFTLGKSYSKSILLPMLIAVIGVSLLPYLSYKNKLDKQLEGFLKDFENTNIFTQTFIGASLLGLSYKNEFEETIYQWKAIIKKIETNTHYFLYTNSVQAIIIPKAAFINKDEKNAFDKILSTTLSLDAQLQQEIKNGTR